MQTLRRPALRPGGPFGRYGAMGLLGVLCFVGAGLVGHLRGGDDGTQPVRRVPAARAEAVEPTPKAVSPPLEDVLRFTTFAGTSPIDSIFGRPGMHGPLPWDPVVTLQPEEERIDPAHPDQIGGIDYSDPVGGGRVPLVRVAGRLQEALSRGFRVRDFASRDGAPYARIAADLVQTLERVRARAGSLVVISGYRHRAYNERVEVGGAEHSQHIAGRAADVWSGTRTPLELAALALEATGCRVGLGLGPNTLHIDLRGRAASWTYPGGALEEAAFDAWVRQQCGGAPADSTAQADSTGARDLTTPPDTLLQALPPTATPDTGAAVAPLRRL